MTRKHLSLVTLEENLEMAADIGIDATTSLDEAFAAAMERHGPDAKVIVLPYARYQLPANMVRMDAVGDAVPGGGSGALTQRAVPGLDARGTSAEAPESREIRGSTTIVELLRMFPGRRGRAAPLAAPDAVRALRRRLPRAADDGGEAAPARPARGASRRSARSRRGGPDARPRSRPRSRASS